MNEDIPKNWLLSRAKLEDPSTPEFHAWMAEDTIARELGIERNRARYMMLLSTIKMSQRPILSAIKMKCAVGSNAETPWATRCFDEISKICDDAIKP